MLQNAQESAENEKIVQKICPTGCIKVRVGKTAKNGLGHQRHFLSNKIVILPFFKTILSKLSFWSMEKLLESKSKFISQVTPKFFTSLIITVENLPIDKLVSKVLSKGLPAITYF